MPANNKGYFAAGSLFRGGPRPPSGGTPLSRGRFSPAGQGKDSRNERMKWGQMGQHLFDFPPRACYNKKLVEFNYN